MGLLLGDTAPNFDAVTNEGTLNFHNWIGDNWAVFFSHPADFTPVCTTELGYTAKLKDKLTNRNAKAIALSIDSLEDHLGWIKDIEQTQGVKMNFPIIADESKAIAGLYSMIHPNADPNVTIRSVFIIDPDKKIRASFTYPPSTGRNFDEILRLLDSFQLTDQYQVATPANWENGDDVIVVPSLTDSEADALFPAGYRKIRSYLRITPQPVKVKADEPA